MRKLHIYMAWTNMMLVVCWFVWTAFSHFGKVRLINFFPLILGVAGLIWVAYWFERRIQELEKGE